jgi:hypothetical protein
MANTKCPWCEAEITLELDERSSGQTCSECLTSWSYIETDASDQELALAA